MGAGRRRFDDERPSGRSLRNGALRPLLVVAALAVAGAASVLVARHLLRPGLEPDRALVAVRGLGTEGNEAARLGLERALRKAGFEVVHHRPSSPDGGAGSHPTLDVLREAAREEGAATVVLLRGTVVVDRPTLARAGGARRPPIFDHFFITRIAAEVATAGEGGARREVSEVLVRKEADSVGLALAASAEEALEILWPEVAAALIESEPVANYVQGLRETGERPPGAESLLATEAAARALRRATADLERACAESSRPLLDGAGPARVFCLSDPCVEEYPVGLTPDGAVAVVQVQTKRLFHTLSEPPVLRFAETPYRLDLVRLSDGRRQTLAYAAAFHGSARLSEDGGTLLFVEVSGPHGGPVLVDVSSGEREVLWASWHYPGHDGRPRRQQLAPRGDRVAAIGSISIPGDGEGPWGDLPRLARGVVVRSADGHTDEVALTTAVDLSWARLALPGEESPEERLAVLLRPGSAEWPEPQPLVPRAADAGEPPPHDHVALVAWSRGLVLRLLDAAGNPVSAILGVRDGALILAYGGADCDAAPDEGGRGLAIVDLAADRSSAVPVEACLEDPVLTGSGSVAATALVAGPGESAADEPELVLVDPETGEVRAVTSNAVEEHSPRGARDARRILFGRGTHGLAPGHALAAVCFVDP